MKRNDKIILFLKKIMQVLFQILLIPLSAIITVGGAWIVWYSIFMLIVDPTMVFLAVFAGVFSSIFTVPIAYIALMGVSTIKNMDYLEEDEKGRKLIIIFMTALPCRIISIIASIVACFTNKFYVSIKRPANYQDYNSFLFKYFAFANKAKDSISTPKHCFWFPAVSIGLPTAL